MSNPPGETCRDTDNNNPPAKYFDNFQKENLLTRGSYSNIYKCMTTDGKFEFVTKEIHTENSDKVYKAITALRNEINIYKRLEKNDRVLKYFGSKKEDDYLSIFMEYMPGGSLKDQIDRVGTLEFEVIARCSKQILEGLAFLHRHFIIHRDVKASNVLIDADRNLKLCGFGVSKHIETVSRKIDVANTLTGSPYWMAPEVIRGDDYSLCADFWSLGATVVEMLTGNPPGHKLKSFDAMREVGKYNKVIYESPKKDPPSFTKFINTLFNPLPKDRGTAETLLELEFIRGQ